VTDERTKVDHDVQAWYADPSRWAPQGKSYEWPDRVLLADGEQQGALVHNKDVLNLGCFYPEDELYFGHTARTWTAIDFVPDVIALCLSRFEWTKNVSFLVADMRALPFADASFDVVTDFSSGDHLLREDWHKVITEAHRVLRPAGHFLVCYANRAAFEALGPYWKECGDRPGDYGYVRTDTKEAMQQMLEERGFMVIKHSHDNVGQLRSGMLAVKRSPARTSSRP